MRPARTETVEHTISGLLTKCSDMFRESETIRDRPAEIKNDIDALDRVLRTLGYNGDLDAAMPRQKRHMIFGKGELTRAILRQLRLAKRPLTCREIADALIDVNGMEGRDQRLRKEVGDRVFKALRVQRERGSVKRSSEASGADTYHAG